VKNVYLRSHGATNCEGITRRDALKVGGLSFLGLSLPEFLRMRKAAAETASPLKDKNCILLFMNGGPSHMDTWDLKPDAPAEYRGEFNPIPTNVDGMQISEHFPRLAKHGDKLAIVRSVTSPEGSHERACHYMLTGQRILPTLEYPAYGSVLVREKGFKSSLPPYVALPQTLRGGGAGYMGAVYQPFSAGRDGKIPDATSPVGEDRMKARAALLKEQDAEFRRNDPDGTLGALDEFYERAYDLVSSGSAKKAFSLAAEPDAVKEAYGSSSLGQGCLLARRLVEAGTRFVTVSFGGWDTHGNNFKNLKEKQLPPVDAALSALLADLQDRGMLDDTLVLWMGEFGRTPKINKNAGRDHYPKAQSVVFAGGGVRAGQVVGATDATGSLPAERPVTPEDMAATIYHLLGVDGRKTYVSSTGRPIRIVEKGQVVRELTG